MNALLRFCISVAVGGSIFFFADEVLHIRPSLAEVVLVAVVMGVFRGVDEALR